MDRITAATVFIDVAKTGSFTNTAERLDMSRPMVTRCIDTMESWLGVRLFHRTTRKVALTTVGASCLEDIQKWLDDAEVILNQVKPSNELHGSIRIAASMSFGHAQLAAAISQFMAQYSKVRIDLDLEDRTQDLIESRIDLAIRIASAPDPTLIGKPIAKCSSMLVASSAYLKANKPIKMPSDLPLQQCLGYKNFERHIWHLSQGDTNQSVEVSCRLTANEATALMQAAIHNAGVTVQPTYLVKPYVERGKLVHVLPEWKPQDMDIYVLYPSRKHLSPTVRALIDFLSEYFKSRESYF